MLSKSLYCKTQRNFIWNKFRDMRDISIFLLATLPRTTALITIFYCFFDAETQDCPSYHHSKPFTAISSHTAQVPSFIGTSAISASQLNFQCNNSNTLDLRNLTHKLLSLPTDQLHPILRIIFNHQPPPTEPICTHIFPSHTKCNIFASSRRKDFLQPPLPPPPS